MGETYIKELLLRAGNTLSTALNQNFVGLKLFTSPAFTIIG